ncbi:gamma-glutamyltransferase [Caballeronia sp. 15711]|uniref:gamma-glutamyltransferase n=1 Tax=Caballeronia sp. 15711 TaxID=3391029 RepID=UPI0039E4BC7C
MEGKRWSATGVLSAAIFACVSWSGAFVGTVDAIAKTSGAAAPAVLTAAAYAVPDKYSAAAAEQIMKLGGNAVDAAVAIAFTLAVTYPEAGNIGGGGFMTLYVNGAPHFLDYRERAPLAASATMYLDQDDKVIPDSSLIGARAVGVPGTVDGMWQAQHRFGRLSWKQVLAPALHYATDGFIVDEQLQSRRDDASKYFAGKTNFDRYFGKLKAGETCRQPELAAVLTRITEKGESDFYDGETANLIANSMKQHGGLITRADLRSYRAIWRQPVQSNWNGYRVITAPPPSSGGIGLVQLLKMKEDNAPLFNGIELNSPHYIHLIAEIEKRVFADRAQYLGDPDFYEVPVTSLIDEGYIRRRAAEVNPTQPSDTLSVKPGLGTSMPERVMPEKSETTHFSVIDKWGNAVSNTYTLNGGFGSGLIAEGTGMALNDEMDDFSSKPGVPNMFGVVGSDANSIAPKKRPLSSMTPTILTKNGKVALVIGTPGGSRIFTSVFQVITNLYDFRMPLKEAVAAMRFHHQLLPPNTIFYEPYMPITGKLADQLEALGYTLASQDFSGDIQAIQVVSGTPSAVADPRGRGIAGTFNPDSDR